MDKDIFEDTRQIIGCAYISDLVFYKDKVEMVLKAIDKSQYSSRQLEDLKKYISGESRSKAVSDKEVNTP